MGRHSSKLIAVIAIEAVLACRGGDGGEVGADGKRHYWDYSSGEVTGPGGRVNVYAATGAKSISAIAALARPLVYVPNSQSSSVTVIDPRTYTVVRTFDVGKVPQHVVPSYDLRQLWVLNNASNSVTPIDPFSGMEGEPIDVDD